MTLYPAQFEQDGSGFVVTFRDVPEAIAQGEDFNDALQQARDALDTAITFYIDHNEPLPEPSAPKVGDVMIMAS
jgi:antitoxin HicB